MQQHFNVCLILQAFGFSLPSRTRKFVVGQTDRDLA